MRLMSPAGSTHQTLVEFNKISAAGVSTAITSAMFVGAETSKTVNVDMDFVPGDIIETKVAIATGCAPANLVVTMVLEETA